MASNHLILSSPGISRRKQPPSVFPWICNLFIGVYWIKWSLIRYIWSCSFHLKLINGFSSSPPSTIAWDTWSSFSRFSSPEINLCIVAQMCSFFLPWGLWTDCPLMIRLTFYWSLDLSLKITFSGKLFLVYFLPTPSPIPMYALLHSLIAFSTLSSIYLFLYLFVYCMPSLLDHDHQDIVHFW